MLWKGMGRLRRGAAGLWIGWSPLAPRVLAPRVLAIALMGWLCFFAVVAKAQGSDVVMLTNGGRLRGTVEVYEPGQDVVIVLSDGSRRVVPAAEVAQVTFGDAVTPVEPPPEPAPVDVAPDPATPPAPSTPPPAILSPTLPPPSASSPSPGERAAPGELPEVQHLGALAPIAGVPQGASREYALAEEPRSWESDPATRELPPGPLHLGVELRGGLRFVIPPFGTIRLYPGLDLSAVLDYRPIPRFHLRAAAVLGYSDGEDSVSRTPTILEAVGTGFGTLGVRLMLGFDLARLFILRIGGELGGEYLPTVRRVELYGGPEIDILGQLTDLGNLEIGLAFAFQRTNLCTLSASVSNPTGTTRCSEQYGLRIQVLAGWLF